MEVFGEERRHLLAVPRPFDGYVATTAGGSNTEANKLPPPPDHEEKL